MWLLTLHHQIGGISYHRVAVQMCHLLNLECDFSCTSGSQNKQFLLFIIMGCILYASVSPTIALGARAPPATQAKDYCSFWLSHCHCLIAG